MIIYENNLRGFINDCEIDNEIKISDKILLFMNRRGFNVGNVSEINSWNNSLPFIAEALNDDEIDKDINVAVEYKLDVSSNRIDFLIYGKNYDGNNALVIVELKGWDFVKSSNKPNFVYTNGGGGYKDYLHPSYQSFRYGNILLGFNEYVQESEVNINSCSYLHNMDNIYKMIIDNYNKYPFVKESPVFLKEDAKKLKEFVKKYVKKGNRKLLYKIDNAKIRPSKDFANMMTNAIRGKDIFTLDDNQASSVSTIINETNYAIEKNKRATIIIKGGPGTGKSIVAINAMGQLLNPKDKIEGVNACFTTPNFTPKALFSELLIDNDYKKAAINNLFKSLSAFSKAREFDYDCIIVDEAHRAFTWKFGHGVKKTIDMIDKLFYASRVNVFFIDEDQRVTKDDFLTIDKIKEYAKKYKSEIIESDELVLSSQFRCMGGENYISFIDSFLGYKKKINKYNPKNYQFKVFDKPSEVWKAIKEKQNKYPNSRLLSGYTKEWVSVKDENLYDFKLEKGNFKMKWNAKKSTPYILDETQFDRIGSIHTIQGVDMDYAGVIIGKDLIYREGKLIFQKDKIAKSDRTSGIRTASDQDAKTMIRNTYKVLLTRAIYGTFVYCEDEELNKHLKSFLY